MPPFHVEEAAFCGEMAPFQMLSSARDISFHPQETYPFTRKRHILSPARDISFHPQELFLSYAKILIRAKLFANWPENICSTRRARPTRPSGSFQSESKNG
jgi:hypothetical protein